MKELIIRKEKVVKIRQQLHKLGKVYDKAVEEYKNFTLKQLRVPLSNSVFCISLISPDKTLCISITALFLSVCGK